MRLTRLRPHATATAAAAVLSLAAGMLAWSPPAQAAARVPLIDAKPGWATAKADQGGIPAPTVITTRVYLAGRDPSGLTRYAQAVSDPHSPLYRKFLSPQEVRKRFGTTPAEQASVTSWLKSSGLKVAETTDRYVTATGSAASAEKAFGTRLHDYTTEDGTYFAPSTTPSTPASLQAIVAGVAGLDSAPRTAKRAEALPGPTSAFVNAGPFSSYYGSTVDHSLPAAYGKQQPAPVRGYTGQQLRAAYGATQTGLTGKGVKVAIVDAYASPTMAEDAATYAARNGDKAWTAGQFSQVLPSDYRDTKACDASGWYGEESLDVEAVHAVAPDARVLYVGARSCEDDFLLDSVAKVVDNHLADLVSASWGDVETNTTAGDARAYDRVFMEGAVEGIGFYFSSGDSGDESAATGTKQVDTPADSPWVTSVGGTSLAVGKNDSYLFETGWGTMTSHLSKDKTHWAGLPGTFGGGAGGGTSTLYKQPAYQRGVVPEALARANGHTSQRTVPDIAAVADPDTGFLIGQTQTFSDGTVKYGEDRIGGTSLAAPVIAGIQALAQQAQGGAIGFANPLLYARYGTSAYHDVTDHPFGAGTTLALARTDYSNHQDASKGTTASLHLLGKDSSLSATAGYDDVSGVGTPTANYLTSFLPQQRR